MRTNIVIDDELLAEAQRLCGASTKRATVEFALQELVRRRARRKVLDLQGRVEWAGDLGKCASIGVIAVDTSVWIDLFRGATTPAVDRFVALIDDDAGIAITDVILTEILQGLRSEADVRRVERRLAPFDVLRLEKLDDYRRAASLYRGARRRGITIRRTLDCLIASVCIREDVALLHADADFDRLASCSPLRLA